jgi:hypothetical protein
MDIRINLWSLPVPRPGICQLGSCRRDICPWDICLPARRPAEAEAVEGRRQLLSKPRPAPTDNGAGGCSFLDAEAAEPCGKVRSPPAKYVSFQGLGPKRFAEAPPPVQPEGTQGGGGAGAVSSSIGGQPHQPLAPSRAHYGI